MSVMKSISSSELTYAFLKAKSQINVEHSRVVTEKGGQWVKGNRM